MTHIDEDFAVSASLDELLARALRDRDPDSATWTQSWHSASSKPDVEATARWTTVVLLDPAPHARLFAAEVLHALATGPAPCRQEILPLLRSRLTAEPDAAVLASLLATFAEYQDLGLHPEIVAQAEHPDARVRRQVAEELCSALMDPGSLSEGADLLATLASDSDGRVRASAVRVLCAHAFDHPVTGQAIAVNRNDPDPHVRPEVLSALARSGDATACAELTRLADEAEPGSQLALKSHNAEHWMRKILSARPPGQPAGK